MVFITLHEHNLLINPDKSIFAQPLVNYLGHKLSATGVLPLDSHIQAIHQFPTRTYVKQLQRFLGLLNFYRHFLPGVAGILSPLTNSLKGHPKKLQWTPIMQQAFDNAKQLLLQTTPLQFRDPSATMVAARDASDTQVGAVFHQLTNSGWKPLAFFSAKLISTQQKSLSLTKNS
jgi:hypothetical protein